MFLGKGVQKIYGKFTGEDPCRSVFSIKLLTTLLKITLGHWCSAVNRTPFPKDISEWLLLSCNEKLWKLLRKLSVVEIPFTKATGLHNLNT